MIIDLTKVQERYSFKCQYANVITSIVILFPVDINLTSLISYFFIDFYGLHTYELILTIN